MAKIKESMEEEFAAILVQLGELCEAEDGDPILTVDTSVVLDLAPGMELVLIDGELDVFDSAYSQRRRRHRILIRLPETSVSEGGSDEN